MPRTSESFDTDLAVLITDETSATHDAVDTVGGA
jgi:hypothetical protein